MAVSTLPKPARDLHFTRPEVTPKAYISKGPSAWPEVFKRADADKELASFLAPLKVDDVVQMFVDRQSLRETVNGKREVEEWTTVVGFIARTIGIPHHEVPHVVGIAFWGRTIVHALGGAEDVN